MTGSAEETRAFGAALAALCEAGDVVLLSGDLGAGKTTLAQGFGRSLGVDEQLTSPTFVIVRHHACGPEASRRGVRTLLHADVYRLDRLSEVADLGLGELVEDGAIALVEWGEVAEPVLGADLLTVRLELGGDEAVREITVLGHGTRWDERAAALADALAPWAARR